MHCLFIAFARCLFSQFVRMIQESNWHRVAATILNGSLGVPYYSISPWCDASLGWAWLAAIRTNPNKWLAPIGSHYIKLGHLLELVQTHLFKALLSLECFNILLHFCDKLYHYRGSGGPLYKRSDVHIHWLVPFRFQLDWYTALF